LETGTTSATVIASGIERNAMSQQARLPKALPAWALRVGSLVIGVHFLAVGTLILSGASGPWPTRFGESPALGPVFAGKFNEYLSPYYLEPLRLTNNHSPGNRLLASAVYFVAQLKDANGVVVQTLKLPGDTGNPWLRHRYNLLALGLGSDIPVQAPRGEVIPAPGDKMPKMTYWDSSDPKLWKLKTVDEHLVPKDRPVMRPSEYSLLLARSYQRYLCRRYDVASVELIRHSKDQVMPGFMFGEGAPPGTFEELVCSFGEYHREK
jgi:hypothetical protein